MKQKITVYTLIVAIGALLLTLPQSAAATECALETPINNQIPGYVVCIPQDVWKLMCRTEINNALGQSQTKLVCDRLISSSNGSSVDIMPLTSTPFVSPDAKADESVDLSPAMIVPKGTVITLTPAISGVEP